MSFYLDGLLVATASYGAVSVLLPGIVRMVKKMKKVTVELTEDELKSLAMWANRANLSIKDYAKQLLVTTLPPPAMTEAKDRADRQEALDRAFGTLDQADANYTAPGVLPLPPSRRAVPGGVAEENRTHPLQRLDKAANMKLTMVPPGKHPCIHLGPGPNHMKGQCQGACNHREQRGKTCYWPPASASNCELFESKTHNRV